MTEYNQMIYENLELIALTTFINTGGGFGQHDLPLFLREHHDFSKTFTYMLQQGHLVKFNGKFLHVTDAPIRHKTFGSAGADVQALECVNIPPKETRMIKSNCKLYDKSGEPVVPPAHFVIAAPRSSFHKRGLIMANSIGVIDRDFQNFIQFAYTNISDNEQCVVAGEDIGQVICVPCRQIFPVACVERTGGFGSTDERSY